MIDIHCHLLPGIDDGPESLEGSLALARAQVEAGVNVVAATPHVDLEYGNRSADIQAGIEQFKLALVENGIELKVVNGAEITLTLANELDKDELAALRLGDGPWLLLEAPLSAGAFGFEHLVRQAQTRGHKVLLAHPERCPEIQRNPNLAAGLVSSGALMQITAGSLSGSFGRTVQECAFDLVARGLVHNVASDAHDARRRPPGLLSSLEEVGMSEYASYWCESVPAAIISGGEIPNPPTSFPAARSKSWRRDFGRR